MSILSDSELLLNYVRNSFIFGDDTGICEIIIEKDFPPDFCIQDALNGELSYAIADTTCQQFRSSSPEIPLTSNTANARKLSSEERIKEVELNDSKIPINHRYINFGEWPRILSDEEVLDFFGTNNESKPIASKTSLLTKLIEETKNDDVVSVNIFSNFAKFSALRYTKSIKPNSSEYITNQILVCENDPNKPLRDFHVYFWDFEEQRNRSNPVIIRPIWETKVFDLIGLACWKYVEENRCPFLTNSSIVSKLRLYMFEDIDDLDLGFGSLNNNDPVYKYQFNHFAILECQRNGKNKVSVNSIISENSFVTQSHMEKMGLRQKSLTETDSITDRHSISNSSDITDGSILVQVQLAHGVSKFLFKTLDTTVEQIIQRTVNKRHLLQHGENYRYKLELASEPNKELDLNMTLNQFESFSFVLVRDMSRRKPAIPDLIDEESSSLSKNIVLMEKQIYNVYLKQPLKRWESFLSISQDLIEIESLHGKLPFRIKPKVIRIPIIFLADCIINYHDQNQQDSSKVTIKFIHLKSKSTMAKSLKASIDSQFSVLESETSSIKSQNRSQPDIFSQTQDLPMDNLLTELTNHSVSCQYSVGKLIYDQTMSIINFKNCLIRKEYLILKN